MPCMGAEQSREAWAGRHHVIQWNGARLVHLPVDEQLLDGLANEGLLQAEIASETSERVSGCATLISVVVELTFAPAAA